MLCTAAVGCAGDLAVFGKERGSLFKKGRGEKFREDVAKTEEFPLPVEVHKTGNINLYTLHNRGLKLGEDVSKKVNFILFFATIVLDFYSVLKYSINGILHSRHFAPFFREGVGRAVW